MDQNFKRVYTVEDATTGVTFLIYSKREYLQPHELQTLIEQWLRAHPAPQRGDTRPIYEP